jgi:UDP-glucose 4-epimerase
VLVTGGSGFIGSHVVDKLRARGHEPVIYDLRPSPWHNGRVDAVLGSITDREALERALYACDAVAHLAAVADVNDVHAEPEDAERVNARGTIAVLEACRQAGVGRIVYASTIWVYSDCAEQNVDEETLLPAPSHLYTSTKLAGELYCHAYQELYGLNYTILRFGIPYGPRAREAAVIPAFVNKALSGEALTLAGDGMQSRRFVYVEDLADGVVAGLAQVATNRVYNLAGEESVTIRQIAETVQTLIGDTEIVYTPARPGDFGGKVVSSARARTELAWTAGTPFAEGVGRYVEWRRAQASLPLAARPAAMIPAGEPDAEARPRKVLIISADIGEGHDLPARAIARELRDEEPDIQVSVVNGLPAMGPILTRVLRDNSRVLFRWAPWLFELQYLLLMYFAPTRWLARRGLTAVGGRGLMRLIEAHDPNLVISTYPGVTAVLGELRRRGRLRIPCYSAITDLAGLQHWAHPGIDLHFVTHPESVDEVERIAGAGSARWARPPTSPAFLTVRSRAQARQTLGLDVSGQVIAVSGGGWGVGDVVGATGAALEVPDATVLCLCGRNDGLRAKVTRRFADEPRVRVMGFTDRMGDVLAAADVLIHSTAGLTVLEAIIRGCPVISYGFGFGHVRASNRALGRFGLAQVVGRQDALAPAIRRALETRSDPDPRFARRPSTASLVLRGERRVAPRPAWRTRGVRAGVSTAATALVLAWLVSTGTAYSVVSHIVDNGPVTAVHTSVAQVGVMVDTSAGGVPRLAAALAARGMHVSFAVDQPSAAADAAADTFDDQTLPRLADGGVLRWLRTRARLNAMMHALGDHHHFLYASNHPSLGQWFLARGAGGRPIAGKLRLQDLDDLTAHLGAGEVIEVVPHASDVLAMLAKLRADLRAHHLRAVPVGRLMRDAGRPV